jgi:C4-dicarboxylate-specific signal transduction histidine kinase
VSLAAGLDQRVATFLLDTLSAGVAVFSYSENQMLWCNAAFRKRTWFGSAPGGRRAKRVVLFDLFPESQRESLVDLIQCAREYGHAFDPERPLRRGSSRCFPAEIKIHDVPRAVGDEPLYCLEFIDLSVTKLYEDLRAQEQELRKTQADLVQASRMASLGEMAGGVAHEINSPLAILQGAADLLGGLVERPSQDVQNKMMALINRQKRAIERVAAIVRSLQHFSGGLRGQADCVPCSVAELAREALDLWQEQLQKRGIELRLVMEADTSLECRSVQIVQVIYQLIKNAAEAVESCPDAASRWIELDFRLSLATDDALQWRVVDGGPGVVPSIQTKIMDPFFTTKGVGQGFGLGLSVSKGIVASHGGQLRLDTEARHTTFVIDIPRRQGQSLNEGLKPQSLPKPA